MQLLRLRVGDCTTQAAADNCCSLVALELRGNAERADKVMQAVAFLHLTQLDGGCANFLNDNGNGALFPIIFGNGQRNTLAFSINTENDKLTRFSLLCNIGSIDYQENDVRT